MYFEYFDFENPNRGWCLTKVKIWQGLYMLICNYDFYHWVPWWKIKHI